MSSPAAHALYVSDESLVARLREENRSQERSALLEVLRKSGGNLSEAARILGKSRGAVRYRARKFGFI